MADLVDDDGVPKWLKVMRTITGTEEVSGSGDNPKILAMADWIGRTYPEMEDYCAQYTHDDIAWCGLTVAFCMTVAGIRPVFGPTDTDKFLWALAWSDDPKFGKVIGRPVLGCVVVMTREGGGHVTLFEGMDGNGNYRCRGGNQSDAVNVQSYNPDAVVALVWPIAAGDVPEIPVEERPMLEMGDTGPDVIDLQTMLPKFTGDIDGDFGPTTQANVIAYQRSRGLEVDGVVGQQTWQALYEDTPPLTPPEPPPDMLTPEQQAAVCRIANSSDVADYEWDERGQAPVGYIQGMALSFAQSYKKLRAGHPAAIEMAKARTASDKDVCNEYLQEFRSLGMSNEKAGADVLRNIYAFMLGSGMCESSGEHCCGRDRSAGESSQSSDTAEAGAFQTSYNAAGASNPEFDDLMDEYLAGKSPGYLEAWSEDVSCSAEDWDNYGSGRGMQFQRLCKEMPAFSAETHALTLRNLCNHYGPTIRHEVELTLEAGTMFKLVQDYMDTQILMA